MPNAHRGQITFQLGDKTLNILVNFNNIARLEEGSGKGINKIILETVDPSQIKISSLASLLYYLQDSKKKPLSLDEIGGVILENITLQNLAPLVLKIGSVIIPAILGRTEDELIAMLEKKEEEKEGSETAPTSDL
jgi:hypothetical protein